jgi:cytochrome b561
MVLMIAVIVPVGFVMTSTYEFNVTSRQMEAVNAVLSQIHHTLGFLILILTLLRLVWRAKEITPAPPTGSSRAQVAAARLNHALLYLLLFLLPLSGWAAMSVFDELPTYFFWIDDVPDILPRLPLSHTFGYSFFGRMHVYALYVGGALLTVHAGAALWHHFAKKDSVLRRMWPLASAD